MTREEKRTRLIRHLKYNRSIGADYLITDEDADEIIEALEQEPCEDMGEVSDGYHTFNQLYHQRAVLFATIVNQNKDKSWKSFKHSDGNYCFDSNGEWFIVGIDTPQGSYTYHYAKEYWDMFDCEELECGKEWDGHTEEDVTRLLSLKQEPCDDCINRQAAIDSIKGWETVPVKVLELLPSVTPQQKVGQWEWEQEPFTKNKNWGNWHCSKCREIMTVCSTDWAEINKPNYKYCFNCGAKMQEVEE